MIHLVISPLPEVEVAQKGAVSLHPPVFSLLRDPCNHPHLGEPKWLAAIMFDPFVDHGSGPLVAVGLRGGGAVGLLAL